ncbi:hypothetical protein [Amycolatopsis sp. FDAARGOS 1241]|uniref:hypothetical protein n=1 Tax=Amycolatopsis sp. FDAARGOS 1241 TaxID=2778070 RepID=UPI001EF38B9A|nr:hypothetical protein [Amycolatopsis sp. FDAARGOS 1241]
MSTTAKPRYSVYTTMYATSAGLVRYSSSNRPMPVGSPRVEKNATTSTTSATARAASRLRRRRPAISATVASMPYAATIVARFDSSRPRLG